MKIKVEVEIFPGRKKVEVEITSDDLRALAEKKTMDCYVPELSCRANTITIVPE